VRVLLDTAVLIFAVESTQRLSKRAITVLKNPQNIRALSAISLMEIAIKRSLGKLNISAAMAREAIQDMDIHSRPITPFVCSNCRRITAILLTVKSLPRGWWKKFLSSPQT
jgi:PIN domain nuclease of toxin-antitoxin system